MAAVLVVEDEEQVRVLAVSFLEGEGYKVLSAATLEQALALLKGDESIDLMFLDVGLRDDLEAGLALAKQSIELCPDLKVLYTTGQGVTDGMRAPYTTEQLKAMLAIRFRLKAD